MADKWLAELREKVLWCLGVNVFNPFQSSIKLFCLPHLILLGLWLSNSSVDIGICQ
jgi:hypothetical protein